MKLATANEQSINEFNLVKLVNTSLKKIWSTLQKNM